MDPSLPMATDQKAQSPSLAAWVRVMRPLKDMFLIIMSAQFTGDEGHVLQHVQIRPVGVPVQ